MPNRTQEVIDRYLRGEASVDQALEAFREYMDSNVHSGLSMSWDGLSPEQRARAQVLVGRWNEVRKHEADRLIAEARKAGRDVAEITFRERKPGKTDPGQGS